MMTEQQTENVLNNTTRKEDMENLIFHEETIIHPVTVSFVLPKGLDTSWIHVDKLECHIELDDDFTDLFNREMEDVLLFHIRQAIIKKEWENQNFDNVNNENRYIGELVQDAVTIVHTTERIGNAGDSYPTPEPKDSGVSIRVKPKLEIVE